MQYINFTQIDVTNYSDCKNFAATVTAMVDILFRLIDRNETKPLLQFYVLLLKLSSNIYERSGKHVNSKQF